MWYQRCHTSCWTQEALLSVLGFAFDHQLSDSLQNLGEGAGGIWDKELWNQKHTVLKGSVCEASRKDCYSQLCSLCIEGQLYKLCCFPGFGVVDFTRRIYQHTGSCWLEIWRALPTLWMLYWYNYAKRKPVLAYWCNVEKDYLTQKCLQRLAAF